MRYLSGVKHNKQGKTNPQMTQMSEERLDEGTCAVIGAAVESKALGRLTGVEAAQLPNDFQGRGL